MIFNKIEKNSRVEIECENKTSFKRIHKGIILKRENEIIYLVSDYGELLEIDENDVLSINKINFDKRISQSINEAKNYYQELLMTKERLIYLESLAETYKNKLYDANFLAKFNIEGATNRLKHSINNELFSFVRDEYSYKTYISNTPDNQIVLNIKIFNTFEYYNLDELSNVDKIIKVHAPNKLDLIKKSFNFAIKVEELDKNVAHERNSTYSVCTNYKVIVDINVDNFLDIRTKIINALNNLRK